MGIQKITFDGSSVSSKIDAEIYHFLLSEQVGIFKNFKSGVSFTLSSNVVTFLEGYISIYGRLIYIENNTQINITPDSNKYGYVVLGVDTNTNEVSIYLKENTSSYPTLITTNISNENGLYELTLCAYNKTPSSVTLNLGFERLYINDYKNQIELLKTELSNKFAPKEYTPNHTTGGSYKISGVTSQILQRSIIHIVISGTTVVTVPGAQMFYSIGSNASVSYRHNANDFSLYLSYLTGVLTMTCGAANQSVTKVILFTF